MMQARRHFLDAGHYQPMRDAVSETLHALLPDKADIHLLDIGCGEGYYTHHLAKTHHQSKTFGLDISKSMIQAAAKRYKECHFVVASSLKLPFQDAFFDAIIRIYAPCNAEELSRTLKKNGLMITVTPGPRHLYQLKAHIYDEVRLHPLLEENVHGLKLEIQKNISYPMSLNPEEASMLLQMTPFAWRAPDALWETLKTSEKFDCEADFILRIYRK